MTSHATESTVTPEVSPDTLASLLSIVRDVLSSPDLGVDDEVMDHGGTSLSLVRILTGAQRDLSLTINPLELAGVVTARSLARAAH